MRASTNIRRRSAKTPAKISARYAKRAKTASDVGGGASKSVRATRTKTIAVAA
jgi:hypothetical protein